MNNLRATIHRESEGWVARLLELDIESLSFTPADIAKDVSNALRCSFHNSRVLGEHISHLVNDDAQEYGEEWTLGVLSLNLEDHEELCDLMGWDADHPVTLVGVRKKDSKES